MIINNKKGKPSTKKTHRIRIGDEMYYYSDEDEKIFSARTLDGIKRRAKKLGIEYDLNITSFRNWWLTTPNICTYCNSTVDEYLKMSTFIMQYTGNDLAILRFKSAFNLPNHRIIKNMTKDRIDNNKGYTLDNLSKACWFCNHMRGNRFTFDEWKLIGPIIINKLKVVCL